MKQNNYFRRTLSVVLFLMVSTFAWAQDFEVDGINYNILPDVENEVEVTGGGYSGDIIIPSTVSYDGKTYNVTSIGDEAFYQCIWLTSVTIPNSVTSIGSEAFRYCFFLTSVTIPEGVTSIGDGVFWGCSSLTSITIPEGVTSISDDAFNNCSSLTSVTIPNSVTSIGYDAFCFCSSLTSITIPEGMTSIGQCAFRGCGLTSVIIPNSVTSIGSEAFGGCSNLTSVTIPNSVTSIGNWAFIGCSSLTSINIPESVTSIGDKTFGGCNSLTTIICCAENVPEFEWGDDGFDDITKYEAILYVPASALEAYKEAEQWKEFADIRPIEGEEEVTLAIGDAHYATFMAPFDVEIPENVTAYILSGIDGETLQLDELTGSIPANTPVVLYSNEEVNKTVSGWRNTQGTTYTEGLLTGVYKERQAPVGSYVLQNLEDEVAFYHVEEGAQPTVAANRAYLTVPESANGVKAFRFGNDNTTGIEAIESRSTEKAVIYDMTGRRVEKAVKGMYIIDGKKVMVK